MDCMVHELSSNRPGVMQHLLKDVLAILPCYLGKQAIFVLCLSSRLGIALVRVTLVKPVAAPMSAAVLAVDRAGL